MPRHDSTKSERLLNLLIMLLVQRRYVGKDRIREILYPDSSRDAFEKMFERDKEELRSLGVPIEVGQMDAYFDDEPGYRVQPDQFALPDISLTADEAAVVGLATKVWQHAKLAEATTEAVRKLTALGADLDVSALDIVEPRLNADEPSFDVFLEATQERHAGDASATVRAGRDRVRDPPPPAVGRHPLLRPLVRRRLRHRPPGRADLPALAGRRARPARSARPGAYEVPAGTDLGEVARRLAPASRPPSEWCCWSARAPGYTLRRGADRVEERRDRPGQPSHAGTGSCSTRGSPGLADEILGFGADVVVEEPAGAPGARRRPAQPTRSGGGES